MFSSDDERRPRVAVGFGDSITEGAGASAPSCSWLGVVETLLGIFLRYPCVVHNESLGDNTISPRTTNFEVTSKPPASERVAAVLLHRPHLVFVGFGLNDMRLGTPVGIARRIWRAPTTPRLIGSPWRRALRTPTCGAPCAHATT